MLWQADTGSPGGVGSCLATQRTLPRVCVDAERLGNPVIELMIYSDLSAVALKIRSSSSTPSFLMSRSEIVGVGFGATVD